MSKERKIKYPEWVCHECGISYGRWYLNGSYVGPSHYSATYHTNNCDICGAQNVQVTEPRDYGGLKQTKFDR